MLKIGEFARICRVNRRTLRYYDEEGILSPDIIDSRTGYRYYAPEKIEVFRKIQTYKEAGFTLEEIKELLGTGAERRSTLVAVKRKAIYEQVKSLQAKLTLLDSLGDERNRLGGVDVFWLHKNFKDDPRVVGRWELCGRLVYPVYGDTPVSTEHLEPCHREDVFQKLILLPNGLPWWAFCWSCGFLYQFSPLYQTLIPHPYTLWEDGKTQYMTVRFATPAGLDQGGDPIWLLYRQTEHVALTESETRVFTDDVDLPLIPDPDVEGVWKTIACVSDPQAFTWEAIPRERSPFWVMEMVFASDQACIRRYAKKGDTVERVNPYTRYKTVSQTARGAVLGKKNHIAEEYMLREVEGETLLFVQHKTGDYIYGGLQPKWFVFRRKTGGTHET